jgi:hypothetical protein
MREIEVDRFVPVRPAVIDRFLTPVGFIEAEGSFDVRTVTETDDGTRVDVGAYGLSLSLEFRDRPDGLEYEQLDGPLRTLTTTVTRASEDEGTRITARSEVAVGGPAVLDKLAAWKRRGEFRRALATVADASRDG